MFFKSFAVAATAAALVVVAGPAGAAGPATGRAYQVICIYQVLPGGRPLPAVCVPYPL